MALKKVIYVPASLAAKQSEHMHFLLNLNYPPRLDQFPTH